MGNDFVDWGGQYNDAQFYPLFDLAELAARLGSIVTYDRRGSIIWQDDFANGLTGVIEEVSGTGSLTFLSASFWEHPPFSAVLQAGSTATAYAQIYRRLAIPQSKRIGWATAMRPSPNTSKLYNRIIHYDGTNMWWTYIVADLDAGKLQIRDESLPLVDLDTSLPNLTTGWYFTHFKLVVDLTDHSIVRVLVDDNEYDTTGLFMASQADNRAKHLYVSCRNEGENLVNTTCNVDNLIVTAAEP